MKKVKNLELKKDTLILGDYFNEFILKHGPEEGFQFMRLQFLGLGSTLLLTGTCSNTGRRAKLQDILDTYDRFIEDTKKTFAKDYLKVEKDSLDFEGELRAKYPSLTEDELAIKVNELIEKQYLEG